MFAMLLFCAGAICAPADMGDVEVGGEIGRRLHATVDNNLLVIDAEKDFLRPFIDRKMSDGYIGLGKTIDSFARFAAYTGDRRVIERKKAVVDRLLASQEPDGYLGTMKKESRVKSLWDVHEQAYLVLGLTSDYAFCGEKKSLESARRLAEYLIANLSAGAKVGPADLSPIMGTTGLHEAFLWLSEQSGDARYRDFVVTEERLPSWRMPLVLGRWGTIEGHAYAYIARCLAQLRLYPTLQDKGLLEPTNGVMDFLLKSDGLSITGTCGDHECWHDTQSGTTNLGETCATAYMLRLFDEQLRQTGDTLYGDLMERSIHNALFGAQSPDGRRIRYYTPFEAPRAYHDGDTYCCPCNFRRIMAELPEMVAYARDGGIYVNLYTDSTVGIALPSRVNAKVTQQTDYPNSGKVKLAVEVSESATFPLMLRVPRWAKSAKVAVNGRPVESGANARLVEIKQEWKSGDVVQADFEMPLRLVKGRKTQDGRAAIMHGPLVFGFNPARNPDLAKCEPRLLTLDPGSIEGPFPDDSVHPGGVMCKAKVWEPGAWYPQAGTKEIVLTENADPGTTATYFLVPNPKDERLTDDELIEPRQ
jgi:DUF1680 family protein